MITCQIDQNNMVNWFCWLMLLRYILCCILSYLIFINSKVIFSAKPVALVPIITGSDLINHRRPRETFRLLLESLDEQLRQTSFLFCKLSLIGDE